MLHKTHSDVHMWGLDNLEVGAKEAKRWCFREMLLITWTERKQQDEAVLKEALITDLSSIELENYNLLFLADW